MQQVNGIVARAHADMDVLAENGELLGEVAVHLMQMEEALLRENALLAPVLERMRSPAGDGQVQPLCAADHHIANRSQLGKHGEVVRMHPGADLDHAFGDFRLDLAGMLFLFDQCQQVRRATNEVPVVRTQDHQFQFDAHRERRRPVEFERHAPTPVAGSVSPARRSAHCVASGPTSSSMTTADSTIDDSFAPNSGFSAEAPCTITTAMADMGTMPMPSNNAFLCAMPDNGANNASPASFPASRAMMNAAPMAPATASSESRNPAPVITNSMTRKNWPPGPNSTAMRSWSRSRFLANTPKASKASSTDNLKEIAQPTVATIRTSSMPNWLSSRLTSQRASVRAAMKARYPNPEEPALRYSGW